MFFAHKTVNNRINEVYKDIGRIANGEYDDLVKRQKAIKEIRFKLLSLIKAEEKIAAEFKAVLEEMDNKYNV